MFAAAKAAATAAKSAHITGTMTSAGMEGTVDVAGLLDGTNATVSIDVPSEGSVEMLTVGGWMYIKGDAQFWKTSGAEAMGRAAGTKYIKVAASAAASMGDITIKSLLDTLFSDTAVGALATDTSVPTTATVDGTKVYVLKSSDGGVIDVAADGSDAIVHVVKAGTDSGDISFSEWNSAKTTVAPPASRTITG